MAKAAALRSSLVIGDQLEMLISSQHSRYRGVKMQYVYGAVLIPPAYWGKKTVTVPVSFKVVIGKKNKQQAVSRLQLTLKRRISNPRSSPRRKAGGLGGRAGGSTDRAVRGSSAPAWIQAAKCGACIYNLTT